MAQHDQQLQRLSLRDQALSVLRERLVSGELEPGKIYSAAALASSLGVSNSPVREAMLTLVNQGFMEAIRNRGFRVIPLSDRDRRNVYELRVMIEVPAMGQVAELAERVRERRAEFSAVAEAIVSASQEPDIVAYLEADRQFHIGLLELLDNPQLVSIVDNLRDQTRLFGLKSLADTGELVKSAQEHEPILDALADGDVELSQDLMLQHLKHINGDWN